MIKPTREMRVVSKYYRIDLYVGPAVFPRPCVSDYVLASKLPYFGIKLVSGKSSTFAESNELKFNIFKQTFIITKNAI